ncbi:MAG TPA: hypothetical protein VGE01_10785 [Fimbriimonas sp.]
MEDIRRQDRRLFVEEAVTPTRVVAYFVAAFLVYQWFGSWQNQFLLIVAFSGILFALATAYAASIQRRFKNPRMRALWRGCEDRRTRLKEAMKRMRSEQIADLREVPKTIDRVAENLYVALRRADNVAHEIQQSEKGLYSAPPVWVKQSSDAQSQELYRLADKNIAEYKAQFAGVMAGVERTEAQSAVFMTTLDTLRMKMLGYRLVGRTPEMNSQDFLESLAEARAQLQSIDHALEELDLGHYPKMIAVVPPPPPEDVQQRLGQG